MRTKDSTFKFGIIAFTFAEIYLLFGTIYTAFRSYDPIHHETIGITLAIITAAATSLVLIALIIGLLKWKSD